MTSSLAASLLILFAAGAQAGEYAVTTQVSRPYHVQASTRGKAVFGLMVFHGAIYDGNLRAAVTSYYEPLFKELAEEFPLAVVYPQGTRGRCPWDKALVCWPMNTPWDDAAFIGEVVERVRKEHGATRWLALGISNGGYYLASAIASGETLPFEAVVNCIGGKGWNRALNLRWTPPLTILAGTGDGEPLASARELHAELKSAGYEKKASLRYVEFDGGHEIPEAVLKAELRRLLNEFHSR